MQYTPTVFTLPPPYGQRTGTPTRESGERLPADDFDGPPAQLRSKQQGAGGAVRDDCSFYLR